MKMHIVSRLLLPVLVACLGLTLAGRVTAQTFTALHSFTAADYDRSNMPQGYPTIITNSDGAHPQARLILSGNTLYGTTPDGGPPGFGTVFAVNTDGTGFTNLHIFTAANYIDNGGGVNGVFINSDGIRPYGGLILSGNTLYGTARSGGTSGYGTVFSINTDGTGFTTLHSFADPYFGPVAGLILSGNTLYGTTIGGGSSLFGTVFAVNTDGTGFTTLHSFTAGSDGCSPKAGLILSGNTLYGTTSECGSSGYGTVFAVNTDGTGFRTLHGFFAISDGAYPRAKLILLGNTLYGTTTGGGSSFNGTVFAINTDGTGFRKLHNFTGGSDESDPYAGLIASSSGNTLYGTASSWTQNGNGTVFAVNTNGTGFTTLYRFTGGSDGAKPMADLLLSGNTLYGTASFGGTNGSGTVFSLSLDPVIRPQLTIIRSAPNVILSWPTNATGFVLQSATTPTNGGDWRNWLLRSTITNGQNVVTVNPTSPTAFFRLRQP